ncbi:hypothetical protein [Brevibacillus brevis]|uniref:hypothetical protein n=1 Tax=Brevibacillus brevis TaxID=1393 RepID=UPI0021BD14FE|nr:hypothetical protein [Brevibacillus brevis]
MMITIEKLSIQDAASLFQFESRNRAFFEKSVPSRGDAYYQYDHFLRGLQALLDEQAQGISFFGLIKNSQGDILGRMNLVEFDPMTWSWKHQMTFSTFVWASKE